MSTLALQLGQHFVPKIRTNYGKFNIRYNGPKLWNETDERFKILTPYSFNAMFWCFCYLVIYFIYFFYCIHG